MPTVIPTSSQNSLLTNRTTNPIDAIYNQESEGLTGAVENTNLELSSLIDNGGFKLDTRAYPNLAGPEGRAQLEAIQNQVNASLRASKNAQDNLKIQYDEARTQRLQQNRDAMSITQQSEGFQQAADLQLAQQSFDRNILESDRTYDYNKSMQFTNLAGEFLDEKGNPYYEKKGGGMTLDKNEAEIGDDGLPIPATTLNYKASQAALEGAKIVDDINNDLAEETYLIKDASGKISANYSAFNRGLGFNPAMMENTIEESNGEVTKDNEIYREIDADLREGNTSLNNNLDKIFTQSLNGRSQVLISTKNGTDSTGYLMYDVEKTEEDKDQEIYFERDENGEIKILTTEEGKKKGASELSVSSLIQQHTRNDGELSDVLNQVSTKYDGVVKRLTDADDILSAMSGINDSNKKRVLAIMADRENLGLSFYTGSKSDKGKGYIAYNTQVADDMMRDGGVLSKNASNNLLWIDKNRFGDNVSDNDKNMSEKDKYTIAYLMDTVGGDGDVEKRFYNARDAYYEANRNLNDVDTLVVDGKKITLPDNLYRLSKILDFKKNLLEDSRFTNDERIGQQYFNAIMAGLFTPDGIGVAGNNDLDIDDMDFIKALSFHSPKKVEEREKEREEDKKREEDHERIKRETPRRTFFPTIGEGRGPVI